MTSIFSSIFQWFGKARQRIGGESAAACCSITSLDEIANAVNPKNLEGTHDNGSHDHTAISGNRSGMEDHTGFHNPLDSTIDTILTPFVGYLSLGGILIGWNIFKDFGRKSVALGRQKEILSGNKQQDLLALHNARQALENARLSSGVTPEELSDKINTSLRRLGIQADNTADISAEFLTEKTRQHISDRLAYRDYLNEQQREAQFQRWAAGAASGIASAGILAGQFHMQTGTAAMFGLAGIGAAHFANGARQLKETHDKLQRARQDDPSAADADIRKKHFAKKRRHVARNVAGWGLFTAGASALGLSQIGAWSISLAVPQAAVYAGIGALGAGVAATVIENNIVTGSRFYNTVPGYLTTKMNTSEGKILNEEQVQQENCNADNRRLLSKTYRQDFYRQRGFMDQVSHVLRRTRQKIGAYSTLGLIGYFNTMKFNDKIAVTKTSGASMDTKRLKVLDKLKEESATNMAPEDIECRDNNKAQKLDMLLSAMISSGDADHMMKLLVKRIGKSTGEQTETTDALTGKTKKINTLAPSHPVFDGFTDDYKNDLKENFTALSALAPCCRGNYEAGQIIEAVRNRYCHHDSEANEQQTEDALSLFKQITDQYLLFQLRRDSKEQVDVWSNISDSFSKRRMQEKNASSKLPAASRTAIAA